MTCKGGQRESDADCGVSKSSVRRDHLTSECKAIGFSSVLRCHDCVGLVGPCPQVRVDLFDGCNVGGDIAARYWALEAIRECWLCRPRNARKASDVRPHDGSIQYSRKGVRRLAEDMACYLLDSARISQHF